ncbi:MAG TPA: hypothetical protein VHY31_15020 [Streptosporangiaceae bacterium]|nr:hypothetical protein [Streptosporangiaceae bacterium]
MSALEDRLRDAYRAATQTVQPGAVPDLPAQLGTPQRPPRARPRWTRVLIPVAAAAAVTALGVTASLLATGHSGPAAGGPAMPRFYVESPEKGPLTVYNTATGAVASTIRLPYGLTFTGQVAATGDGRTFVAAFVTADIGQVTPCVTHLYEFRLSQSGRPAPPSRIVATVPGVLLGADDLAVSADGLTIGYASLHDSCYPNRLTSAEVVGVVNVATGQSRSWALPATDVIGSVGSVALSADGGQLAFSQLPVSAQPARTPPVSQVRTLATSAPDGPADRYSQVVARSAEVVALSPDGQSAYLCDAPSSNSVGPAGTATYTVQSLITGKRRFIGRWQDQPRPRCQATLDPSGRYLLISLPDQGSLRRGHFVVADLRTGQLTTLWPSGGKSGVFPPLAVGVAW